MRTTLFLSIATILMIMTGCNDSSSAFKSVDKKAKNYWKVVNVGNGTFRMDYNPVEPQDQTVSVKLINKRDTVDVSATCLVSFFLTYEPRIRNYAPHICLVFSPSDAESEKQMKRFSSGLCTFEYEEIIMKNLMFSQNDGVCLMSVECETMADMYSFFGFIDKPCTLRVKTKKGILETTIKVNVENYIDSCKKFYNKNTESR